MCYENKISIIFFFEISSDQCFFFRFQIIRVTDLAVIFFSDKFFCLVKTYRRNLIYFRKFDLKDLKFLCIVLLKQFHRILKKSCFHSHDIFESVNISHLKIKTGIFIQMTFGIMFLGTEYRSGLKHAIKNTYHHLFVKLRALCKDSRFVEIAEFEKVCTTLGSSCPDLRCMDFSKSLFVEEITESTCQRFLNLEFGALLHITECDRT